MIHVRLVERIDGTWCAYVEGQEDDAVVAPADDAALGRLVRGQARRFGIERFEVTPLEGRAAGELGRDRVPGGDSQAPDHFQDLPGA
jgi:hypothetical protein